MSDKIRWADPPDKRTVAGNGRIQKIVRVLESNPMRWAVIGTYLSNKVAMNMANHIRKANPGIECVARAESVYARWVGGASE